MQFLPRAEIYVASQYVETIYLAYAASELDHIVYEDAGLLFTSAACLR
jgi:hypothetical protein